MWSLQGKFHLNYYVIILYFSILFKYYLQYYSNSDGWVEGNINCKDEVSNKNPVDCPAYARKACFQSKSIFYDNSGNQEVHVDRGCSAFDLQDVECTDKSTSGGWENFQKPKYI